MVKPFFDDTLADAPNPWWVGKIVICLKCGAEHVLAKDDADEITFNLGGCVCPTVYSIYCMLCNARIDF